MRAGVSVFVRVCDFKRDGTTDGDEERRDFDNLWVIESVC